MTPLPGTTRDTVEEAMAVGGIPLRLIDTAGLRLAGESPADEAEALGIARSREALADADLVVVVLDATASVSAEETELLQSLVGRPHILASEQIGSAGAESAAACQGGISLSINFRVNRRGPGGSSGGDSAPVTCGG